jgi:hypothetical protein
VYIDASTDNGTSWTEVAGPYNRPTDIPSTIYWQDISVNVAGYAGQASVKFAFRAVSAWGNWIHIDNVFIGQPVANDLGITAISSPAASISRTAQTITASVKNFGSADQTTYNLHVKTWKTVGGSEGSPEFHQMEAGPAVTAGSTVPFSFATQWTPAEFAAYTVKVYTELAGDETPANDALTKAVTVNPTTDLQVTAVVYPTTTGLYTGTLGYAVRGTVKNNGTSTVLGSNYTVDGWIGPTAGFPGSATYTGAAVFKPDIAPGASVNVDLLPSAWVPVEPGPHTVRIKVTTAGDEITSNDTRDESRTVLSVHFGGPDGGAYYYITDASTNPAKPTYNWLDITGIGTPLNFTSDDQNSAAIPIPSFTLYGNAYTSLKVNNNGIVRLNAAGPDASYYINLAIPSSPAAPDYFLAPFWDDLGLVAGTTNIYYYNDAVNSQFIIEFYQMPPYGQTTDLKTFEVVLNYATNSVFFQYNIMPGNLGGSTVGIEGSGAAGMGTQWLYNNVPAPAVAALVSGRVIYFGTSSTSVPAIASLPRYTLGITTVGNGTVARSPDQPDYLIGTNVLLTATAASGWEFTAWSGDATGSTNPLTVIMNGNKNITATFTLTAVAGFSVSPTNLGFGNVVIGASGGPQTLTVTNTGTATLTISSVASSNAMFAVSPTSGSIPASGTQAFDVTFTPTATGSQTGNITFTHNAAGSPNVVAVTGTGLRAVDVAMTAGWNLVSVPVIPGDFSASALFPAAISGTIYSFLKILWF